jgi:CBS domain-containing protein
MPESVTDALTVALTRVMKRAPVSCPPGEHVRDAIERMRSLGIGSVIVVNKEGVPLGILTRRDVIARVVLEPGALDAPIERVMTRDPITLPANATAYQAALAMIRHGIQHLVLVDEDRLAGVISERDVFGLQSTDVRRLSAAIQGAQDLDAIEQFGRGIGDLSRRMLAQGVAVGALTAFIASLNDLLTERIVQLEFRNAGLGATRWCWILMGSEGRSEQTLLTDQDNGIIFSPAPGQSVESAREAILPAARRINQALDRAGYRRCPGDIMAGNPQWALSLDEWREKFARWIDSGSPEALLHGAIFFDLRPLTGDVSLGGELRHWMLQRTPRNPRFLRQMAENALKNRPPLRMFGRIAVGEDGRIDSKLNGAMPFVDAARIFTLAHGLDEVNTERRLRAAAPALQVPPREMESWIAAFYYIQRLRLQRQAECLDRGVEVDNRIAPGALDHFGHQMLRAAFRQARAIRKRLALDYQL